MKKQLDQNTIDILLRTKNIAQQCSLIVSAHVSQVEHSGLTNVEMPNEFYGLNKNLISRLNFVLSELQGIAKDADLEEDDGLQEVND